MLHLSWIDVEMKKLIPDTFMFKFIGFIRKFQQNVIYCTVFVAAESHRDYFSKIIIEILSVIIFDFYTRKNCTKSRYKL